jgi:putative ABC transport system permease protein
MIASLICYCQQAFINLMSSKLRTCLAVSGILVSTAAIVSLISCSQLATEKALAQFKALGTDLIAVSLFYESSSGSDGRKKEIPLHVWRALPDTLHEIQTLAPYDIAHQRVSFRGKPINPVIIGADESLSNVLKIKLEKGNFVSFMDLFERFCVIGSQLASELKQISIDDPLGKQIQIGDALYTIIGVAAPWKENSFFNEDINQAVIIPIAGMILISKESNINNAIMLLKSDENIDVVIEKIKLAIHIHAPDAQLFVRSAKQIITSMESQGHIFTLLLAVIGGISLLVGGIGVMNVMLIAVSERKKEIGVRKALGAKNTEIQFLFLIESIILSLLGGGFGVVIGLLFTAIVAYFSQWPFKIYVIPILIGVTVSLVTGVFFGFYPARRASLLEPMTSLRGD